MISKIKPCLWFDGQAEEAANFYVSLLPDSHVDQIVRSPADTPSGPEGSVLLVEFTLAGQQFTALNGGPQFKFNESVSFVVDCADQEEVDRLWEALTADESAEECGWLKDRFGLSWQIVPSALPRLLSDPDADTAKRVMTAMLGMKKIDVAGLERAAVEPT
jgi:predicted 3-demethylubiquinone-9 3-methyltransferase (glyoxalase superfamily)